MTRYEQIKSMNQTELAEFFCNFMIEVGEYVSDFSDNEIEYCEICPATKLCKLGHAGYIDWLDEDANNDKKDL